MSQPLQGRDATKNNNTSTWTAAQSTIEQAIIAGREQRLRYGSGLDVLLANLKNGTEPDLIAASKKTLLRVY